MSKNNIGDTPNNENIFNGDPRKMDADKILLKEAREVFRSVYTGMLIEGKATFLHCENVASSAYNNYVEIFKDKIK